MDGVLLCPYPESIRVLELRIQMLPELGRSEIQGMRNILKRELAIYQKR
jgi:hypothetical protein